MESIVLNSLGFELTVASIQNFLSRFLKAGQLLSEGHCERSNEGLFAQVRSCVGLIASRNRNGMIAFCAVHCGADAARVPIRSVQAIDDCCDSSLPGTSSLPARALGMPVTILGLGTVVVLHALWPCRSTVWLLPDPLLVCRTQPWSTLHTTHTRILSPASSCSEQLYWYLPSQKRVLLPAC